MFVFFFNKNLTIKEIKIKLNDFIKKIKNAINYYYRYSEDEYGNCNLKNEFDKEISYLEEYLLYVKEEKQNWEKAVKEIWGNKNEKNRIIKEIS